MRIRKPIAISIITVYDVSKGVENMKLYWYYHGGRPITSIRTRFIREFTIFHFWKLIVTGLKDMKKINPDWGSD